jgi:divalent metal cation (Fe/Co/Zn/Cd) transporter
MKDSSITASVQSSKVAFAMSRESWQIFLIFALATGLAIEELSLGLFVHSRPFCFFMTVFYLVALVGVFLLARKRFFLGRNRPSPMAAMTDRMRAQSALVLTVFFVAGLIGIWLGGSQLFYILVGNLSLTASSNLGYEYADR